LDSDDEAEAVEAQRALEHKVISQATKKSMKNSARLPRTAGLRTLTELSSEMTKAGLDPSKIERRAEMIAKVRGAERKRKREQEENEMDVDDDGEEGPDGSNGNDEEWMDVDGEGGAGGSTTPNKRRKSNTGTSVTKKGKGHQPRTNRQLAGLRDESVRKHRFCILFELSTLVFITLFSFFASSIQQAHKAVKLRNLGQRERNMHAKAGESDRAIRVKMVILPFNLHFSCVDLLHLLVLQPKHLYSGKRKAGKTNRR
jgi:nucleolar GTP-binding protein